MSSIEFGHKNPFSLCQKVNWRWKSGILWITVLINILFQNEGIRYFWNNRKFSPIYFSEKQLCNIKKHARSIIDLKTYNFMSLQPIDFIDLKNLFKLLLFPIILKQLKI